MVSKLVPFARPRERDGGGADRTTFDFLGFTVYWWTSYRGGWASGMKTRKARLQRTLRGLSDWCRRYRDEPLREQHATLTRKLTGHYNYFAVSGTGRSADALNHHFRFIWHKWLNRRSQRTRMTWERFGRLLEAYPLPAPTVRVNLWA